jgi:uncharacterized coiled-coil protein SlyX
MNLIYCGKHTCKVLLFLLAAQFAWSNVSSQTYSPPIEFLTSSFGLGYGARIYPLDQGNGTTSLRIAVRGGSTVWTDALIIHADDINGGGLGNIGVGADPGRNYKFAVNGTAIFNKVIVHQYPWPDYVFDSTYRLTRLDSVAEFIRTNHHLAEVPSADSVAKAGIDIGANQATLLKKIEELTLYIIEQDKTLHETRQQLVEERAQVKDQRTQMKDELDRLRQLQQSQQARIDRIERLLAQKLK